MSHRIYSMMELASEYNEFVKQSSTNSLDLGDWLPSFKGAVRPLVPGELAFVLADTGAGKSMTLQNIAASVSEDILFFELELPRTMMYERFMARVHDKTCSEIEIRAKEGEYWSTAACSHVWICDDTRLTALEMMEAIDDFEKEHDHRPYIVMVDYIGLMAAQGKSRYERMSYAAEELKVLAKQANVIVVAATQRSRPERDSGDVEVTLHDSKDSGSIENSCGLLLGMWKTGPDALTIRVLKNTKGRAGFDVECNFDGARMTITERSKNYGTECEPDYQDR